MAELGLLLFIRHPRPEGSAAQWVTQPDTDGEFGKKPHTL